LALPDSPSRQIYKAARKIRVAPFFSEQGGFMPPSRKQNLTVSLSPVIVQKAKVLAAKRSTSISGLLAMQIEALVDADEAYERAHRAALDLMNRGFHLGGIHSVTRDQLHER
jgi:hypothetical protein